MRLLFLCNLIDKYCNYGIILAECNFYKKELIYNKKKEYYDIIVKRCVYGRNRFKRTV